MQNYFETNPQPMIAVDFDYFRLPREKWELMLCRLRQMGATALYLSLPWRFHELNQGVIDLNGISHARRDVTGLLDLCAALAWPCLLDIGPYTSGQGVLGEGLPVWLSKEEGSPAAALPAQTKNWHKMLSKILVERQWPHGPLIALRLNSKSDTGQETTLSQQLTEVKWPIWLRKRYHSIEALNEAYDSSYRSVNDATFPEKWAEGATPIEQDARTFLAEIGADTQAGYVETLAEAGWRIPIYPSASEPPAELPLIHTHSLTGVGTDSAAWLSEQLAAAPASILRLQQPIQVEPGPVDLSSGVVWAEKAPIRADGSLRRKFWQIRHALWSRQMSDSRLEAGQFMITAENSALVSCAGDRLLKINATVAPKTPIYRLRLNGELIVEDNLKVVRKKLSGLYLAEDEVDQTDMILLGEATAPLHDFARAYLRALLAAQAQALRHSAGLAEMLSQSLRLDRAEADSPEAEEAAKPTRATTYILGEARRGLKEADVALRKAMASLGDLEGGFATILGKEEASEARPVAEPVAITPEAFKGPARETLLRVGTTCAEMVEPLQAAAKRLQETIADSEQLTLEQYRQSWAAAFTAAQQSRRPLLDLIAHLRLEIASEQLPLLFWRVHDQVQALAEGLRWGVLRGS